MLQVGMRRGVEAEADQDVGNQAFLSVGQLDCDGEPLPNQSCWVMLRLEGKVFFVFFYTKIVMNENEKIQNTRDVLGN